MFLGTLYIHFRSKLKIDIFMLNNFKLLFLKKTFSNFVYDFSDCITYTVLRFYVTTLPTKYVMNWHISCRKIFASFQYLIYYTVVRTIRSNYAVILKTFLAICGVIFENFYGKIPWKLKKLLGIFKKYQKNLKQLVLVIFWWIRNKLLLICINF